MKKLLLILMAAALTAVTFTSCRKSDSGNVTVTFDANGGAFDSGESTLVRTVGYGSTVTKPADPKLEGCIFLGWFLADSTQWNFNDVVTKDMTLYACWQKIVPKEGIRLLVISFKDKFGNQNTHVFQYCNNVVNTEPERRLDTIKVGSDTYPLVYQENRVILTNSAANWGLIDFEKGNSYHNAKSFSHFSGGVFSMEYKKDSQVLFGQTVASSSFLDSISYVINGETTVIAKNIDTTTIGTGNEGVYQRFETEFSDTPSTVTFEYATEYKCASYIFTPVFFTYTFIENAWKETPQGASESILAAAVFNTGFFGKLNQYVPSSVTIKQGGKEVTLNVGFASKLIEKRCILNTMDIKLPEGSYYTELTFYEAYLLVED